MLEDSHWNQIRNPGTLLRCRRSGKLALVLNRSYEKDVTGTSWPSRYVDIQWVSTGKREQELLTNVNNCFEIAQ